MIIDSRQDRFIYFREGPASAGMAFTDGTSRLVIADCRAGWQVAVPADDEAADGLMHEFYYGEAAYDLGKMVDLLVAAGVEVETPPFSAEHCACKVDPSGDTHLVDN